MPRPRPGYSIDDDPWGRSYRIVRNKLRTWAPPITEDLSPRLLDGVITTLFPPAEGVEWSPPGRIDGGRREVLEVTEAELVTAVQRMGKKSTAPGPDGVPGKAWCAVMGILGDRLRRLYTNCLRTGQFPSVWRTAKLVLLRKAGRPTEAPSSYRPICLLDEAGKIIADRLSEHLRQVGPDLAECQFGFRRGRSTIDAVLRVKSLVGEVVSHGGVAIGISLDISNAFNTLPWDCITGALRYHRPCIYSG